MVVQTDSEEVGCIVLHDSAEDAAEITIREVEGIKIAKPILIAGLVYYIAIPLISTFLADRVKKNK